MKLPIEIEIAFMNAIEGAAQGWKDGISDYPEFRSILRQMCTNIYKAGYMEERMETTSPVEMLAELEHEQWAHWTSYMLDNMTPENIERWRKQIQVPYSELSEKEKESDRKWARRAWELLVSD